MTALDAPQRFWSQTDKGDGCWLWTGGKTLAGYGQLSIDYRKTLAHRYAYELLVGPIPPGMEIDHLCRNRSCVNPQHMEAVTHAENMRRQVRRPHCPQGHEMTGHNLMYRKDGGGRICRACRDQRNRSAYQRRRTQALSAK